MLANDRAGIDVFTGDHRQGHAADIAAALNGNADGARYDRAMIVSDGAGENATLGLSRRVDGGFQDNARSSLTLSVFDDAGQGVPASPRDGATHLALGEVDAPSVSDMAP